VLLEFLVQNIIIFFCHCFCRARPILHQLNYRVFRFASHIDEKIFNIQRALDNGQDTATLASSDYLRELDRKLTNKTKGEKGEKKAD